MIKQRMQVKENHSFTNLPIVSGHFKSIRATIYPFEEWRHTFRFRQRKLREKSLVFSLFFFEKERSYRNGDIICFSSRPSQIIRMNVAHLICHQRKAKNGIHSPFWWCQKVIHNDHSLALKRRYCIGSLNSMRCRMRRPVLYILFLAILIRAIVSVNEEDSEECRREAFFDRSSNVFPK